MHEIINYNFIIKVHSLIEENKTIRDPNLIHSAISSYEYYDDVEDQIVSVYSGLLKNHAFIDGNKRVAVIILDMLMHINNYVPKRDSELFDITFNHAGGEYSKEDVKRLLFH